MARYRLKAWFPEKSAQRLTKHRQTKCKICILDWAQNTVREMEYNNHRTSGSAKWTLERINADGFEWQIFWHDGMPEVAVSKRHAHPKPYNSASRTGRNP
jgi:hypothetical protein